MHGLLSNPPIRVCCGVLRDPSPQVEEGLCQLMALLWLEELVSQMARMRSSSSHRIALSRRALFPFLAHVEGEAHPPAMPPQIIT